MRRDMIQGVIFDLDGLTEADILSGVGETQNDLAKYGHFDGRLAAE